MYQRVTKSFPPVITRKCTSGEVRELLQPKTSSRAWAVDILLLSEARTSQ
jgi:hypothetical protein